MEKNSARKSCVWAVKEGDVDDQLVLMSFYFDSVRHSSHFTHFITRPRFVSFNPSRILNLCLRPLGDLGSSGRLSTWIASSLKFRCPLPPDLPVRTEILRRIQ